MMEPRLFSELHSDRMGGDRHAATKEKSGNSDSFSLVRVVKHEDRGLL